MAVLKALLTEFSMWKYGMESSGNYFLSTLSKKGGSEHTSSQLLQAIEVIVVDVDENPEKPREYFSAGS